MNCMNALRKLRRSSVSLGTAMVTVLAFAAPALAQRSAKPPGDESVTVQWAIAIGLLVVIGLPAFLNPKRSHLN